MAMNVPNTEAEQLERIQSTGNADLLQLFSQPSEAVIHACLSLDGNAIRHLLRPTLELQRLAVQTTPTAIEYCTGQKRRPDGPVHPSVQREAYDRDPLVLVWAPDRFDDSLERHTRKGMLAFVQEVMEAMVDYLNEEDPLDEDKQENIRMSVRHFAKTGERHIPVWTHYKKSHPKLKDVWKTIEDLTNEHEKRVALGIRYFQTGRVNEAVFTILEKSRKLTVKALMEAMDEAEKPDGLVDIVAVELPPL